MGTISQCFIELLVCPEHLKSQLQAMGTISTPFSRIEPGENLTGFVGVKGGADFFHVGSVRADRFVELVAGDTKLLGPIGDVGGHLGIDLFQVVRSFGMVFVYGVGLMDFGRIAVLGHTFFLLNALLG